MQYINKFSDNNRDSSTLIIRDFYYSPTTLIILFPLQSWGYTILKNNVTNKELKIFVGNVEIFLRNDIIKLNFVTTKLREKLENFFYV